MSMNDELNEIDSNLAEFLTQHQVEVFREGVVQLLISLVLSRGVEIVRKDMDRPDHTLIGRHNHTSQVR